MRVALATVAVWLAVAATAHAAETVVTAPLDAGPELAGDRVMWSSSPGRELVRVVARRPGGEREVLQAWPAPRSSLEIRAVVDIAATATSAAAVVTTCEVQRGYDAGPSLCANRAFAGGAGGPLGPLGRGLPRRAPEFRDCRPRRNGPVEIEVGGGATAYTIGEVCPDPGGDSAGRVVVLRDGREWDARTRGNAYALRIAGRYVAWRESAAVEVRDLLTGRRVRRIGAGRFAGGPILDLDLTPSGRVAVVHGTRGDDRTCVSTLALAAARPRRMACDATGSPVAAAGRAVLYERRAPDPGEDFATELVLARHGAGPRVLARFDGDTRRTGALDLDGRRALWATYDVRDPGPHYASRIVLQRLG
jgi:hypothetical protein